MCPAMRLVCDCTHRNKSTCLKRHRWHACCRSRDSARAESQGAIVLHQGAAEMFRGCRRKLMDTVPWSPETTRWATPAGTDNIMLGLR